MNLANEGLEARKKEEEVATRKRKAEEDKAWEGGYCSNNWTNPFLNMVARVERVSRGQLAVI